MLFALAFLIVIEQQSPGLVPSMKSSFITAYDDRLRFDAALFTYPLIQAPGAVVADGDDLIAAEGLQLVRHDRFGATAKLGLPLDGYPTAMAFGEGRDLLVTMQEEFARVNPISGAVIRRVALQATDVPTDLDLDAGGCVAYVALLNRLARIDLCADVPHLDTIAGDTVFSAVRILPDGNLLVAALGQLEVRARDGAVARRYDVAATKIALDPSGATAVVAAPPLLSRIDLATGNVVAGPVMQARGINIRAIAVAGEWRAASPHRRRASHP